MHTVSETPKIKIFVSRRIDLDSVSIENPLYIPMRCGAVFDSCENPVFQGDDTGENISEKRMSFCEFTVQYWAWKNARADYYGLCHYRRYLSFAQRVYKTTDQGLVSVPILSGHSVERFGLRDAEKMRELIQQYDMVIPQPAQVSRMPLPHGSAKNVLELWEAHDGIFFDKKVIARMFGLIEEFAPQYSAAARSYFAGGLHRGYNCYIMKRELFERLCEFQFPIMEALEKELRTENSYTGFVRTPAYVGEMMFGIFLHQCIAEKRWKICERQLLLFEETADVKDRLKLVGWYCTLGIKKVLRAAAAPFLPLGSKRRERCKEIYRRFFSVHGGG